MASTSNQTHTHLLDPRRYDVFLSFRGADTRKSFTDHLYTALLRSGLRTFRDNEEMEYGKEVGAECIKAIEESKCSIVVLSKGYASSTWCLDELLHIIERTKITNHWVLPVFFDVDPSDVKQQTGTFKDAFEHHKIMFEQDKVQKWRMALSQVANLKGIDLPNTGDGHEARIIKKVVEVILRELCPMKKKVSIYPVGIDRPAYEVISLLGDSSSDVRTIGLFGMGGIGKTTIAKEVYNTIFEDFDGSCFLQDVNRRLSHDPIGLERLQRQLLSHTLRMSYDETYNIVLDLNVIEERLSGIKVLIVLDDLDNGRQLREILGTCEWLIQGSKIIITTRNKDFLNISKDYIQYEVNKLKEQESLQLLSLHAFGETQPPTEYEDYANEIINYVGGIPLALEVLGSSLNGQGVDVWNNTSKRLGKTIHKDIQNVLEISFQSLDHIDKSLFLDIACFFIGQEKNYIISILGDGGHSAIDLDILVRRCLVSIGPDNELLMHDLLRDVGREIVRQESSSPGKRTRIWDHDDAIEVLMDETGEIEVEGLALRGNCQVQLSIDVKSENQVEGSIPNRRELTNYDLRTKTFKKMKRLRLLQLNYACLTGSFHYLSRKLRWLRWLEFPLNYIPDDLHLQNLVALDMSYSKIRHFPKNVQSLPRLKFLDLSHSLELMRLSNFELFCNLEVLTLDECIRLVELDESIELLSHLLSLSLYRCINLKSLPRNMSCLTSLENLNISGCSKLDEFSLNYGQDFHNGIDFCARLSNILPSNSYRVLNLSGHILNVCPSSLVSLDLSFTKFTMLPIQIGTQLPNLIELWLNKCEKLVSAPQLPPSLMKLHAKDCTSLNRIDLENFVGDELDLRGCHKLKRVGAYYKFETLQAETVGKLLKNCNLFTENSFQELKIRVMNLITKTCYVRPIQGLHDDGAHNIFVPNMEIPSWFYHQNKGDSMDLLVPQSEDDTRIVGAIVAAVYGFKPPVYDMLVTPGIVLFNISTMEHWVYGPNFVFLPFFPMDSSILWLSYWPVDSFSFDGNQVSIKICMGNMDVSCCGIHFLCQDEHDQIDPYIPLDWHDLTSTRSDLWQNIAVPKIRGHAMFTYNEDNEFRGSCASDDLLYCSLQEHVRSRRDRWPGFQRQSFYNRWMSKISTRSEPAQLLTSAEIQAVRCPECLLILAELPDIPVYVCFSCGTCVQAKRRFRRDR